LARSSPRRAVAVAAIAVAVALVENYRLGAMFQAHASISAHDRIAARALRLVPSGAVVSATNTLGAHLSARRRILSFPLVADATWIAADETSPGYADRLAPLPTAVQLSWLRRNPEWRLVFERDGVLVFHRLG